jgi:hypothetical protein
MQFLPHGFVPLVQWRFLFFFLFRFFLAAASSISARATAPKTPLASAASVARRERPEANERIRSSNRARTMAYLPVTC